MTETILGSRLPISRGNGFDPLSNLFNRRASIHFTKVQMDCPRCDQTHDIRRVAILKKPRNEIRKAMQQFGSMNAGISGKTAIAHQTFESRLPRSNQPSVSGAHRVTVTSNLFRSDFRAGNEIINRSPAVEDILPRHILSRNQIPQELVSSWAVYGLGTENQNLPGYVVILDKRGGPISGQPNWSSGFISAAHQGTLFRPTGNPILNLERAKHMDRASQRAQLDLLAQLNEQHLSSRQGNDELATRIQSYELAFRMQAEAPEAVDLSQESKSTLEAYGVGKQPTDEYGRNCLIGRRLLERGVRFVQLYSGGGHLEETWDAHESIEKNHGQHAAEVDQPIAALLADLQERGLLDSTLIVWGGEFGRMPFSEGKDAPGRNHNPYGFTMWFAGAGIQGGVRYGATDEFGFEAVQDRVHLHDIHATILHVMGLDHEALTYFHQGRKESLTDVGGKVIHGILS